MMENQKKLEPTEIRVMKKNDYIIIGVGEELSFMNITETATLRFENSQYIPLATLRIQDCVQTIDYEKRLIIIHVPEKAHQVHHFWLSTKERPQGTLYFLGLH